MQKKIRSRPGPVARPCIKREVIHPSFPLARLILGGPRDKTIPFPPVRTQVRSFASMRGIQMRWMDGTRYPITVLYRTVPYGSVLSLFLFLFNHPTFLSGLGLGLGLDLALALFYKGCFHNSTSTTTHHTSTPSPSVPSHHSTSQPSHTSCTSSGTSLSSAYCTRLSHLPCVPHDPLLPLVQNPPPQTPTHGFLALWLAVAPFPSLLQSPSSGVVSGVVVVATSTVVFSSTVLTASKHRHKPRPRPMHARTAHRGSSSSFCILSHSHQH